MNGQICFELEALIESLEQRAAARKHHAAIENIGGKFRWSPFQAYFHRFDNGVNLIGKCLTYFYGTYFDRFGNSSYKIAALHFDHQFFFERHRTSDLTLD